MCALRTVGEERGERGALAGLRGHLADQAVSGMLFFHDRLQSLQGPRRQQRRRESRERGEMRAPVDHRAIASTCTCRRMRKPSDSYSAIAPALSARSEEHTSELQSLMRISYAVFRLKKNNKQRNGN